MGILYDYIINELASKKLQSLSCLNLYSKPNFTQAYEVNIEGFGK